MPPIKSGKSSTIRRTSLIAKSAKSVEHNFFLTRQFGSDIFIVRETLPQIEYKIKNMLLQGGKCLMKKVKLLFATLIAVLFMCMTVLAGTWQPDTAGFKYQNDDGSYPVNCWQWIDGNNDGIAESYYFDGNGYLLVNCTTPDGFLVNDSGAWVVDHTVQTKAALLAVPPAETTAPEKAAGTAAVTEKAARTTASGISSVPYDGYTIIVNTSTKKYHVPTCRSVAKMKSKNIGYCSDVSYLNSHGYSACKNCH